MGRIVPANPAYASVRIRRRFYTVAIALAALLLVAPAARAQLPSQSDIAEAQAEVASAEQEASTKVPPNPRDREAEDALDQAARANDDAPANDPAAKDNAQKAEDAARARADKIQSEERGRTKRAREADKERAKEYREALKKRRAARRKLQALREQAKKNLPGLGRRETELVMQGLDTAIKSAEQPVQPQTQTAAATPLTNGFLQTPLANLLSVPTGSFSVSLATDSSEDCKAGSGLGNPVALTPISTDAAGGQPAGPAAAPSAGSQVASAPPVKKADGEDCGPAGCGAKVPPVQTAPTRSVPSPVRKAADEDCGPPGCGAKVSPTKDGTQSTAGVRDGAALAAGALSQLGLLEDPNPHRGESPSLQLQSGLPVKDSILDEIDSDDTVLSTPELQRPDDLGPVKPAGTQQTAATGEAKTATSSDKPIHIGPIPPGTLPGLPKVGVTSGGEYAPSPRASLEPMPAPGSTPQINPDVLKPAWDRPNAWPTETPPTGEGKSAGGKTQSATLDAPKTASPSGKPADTIDDLLLGKPAGKGDLGDAARILFGKKPGSGQGTPPSGPSVGQGEDGILDEIDSDDEVLSTPELQRPDDLGPVKPAGAPPQTAATGEAKSAASGDKPTPDASALDEKLVQWLRDRLGKKWSGLTPMEKFILYHRLKQGLLPPGGTVDQAGGAVAPEPDESILDEIPEQPPVIASVAPDGALSTGTVTVFLKPRRALQDGTLGPPVRGGEFAMLVPMEVRELPSGTRRAGNDAGHNANPVRGTTNKYGEVVLQIAGDQLTAYGIPRSASTVAGASYAATSVAVPHNVAYAMPVTGSGTGAGARGIGSVRSPSALGTDVRMFQIGSQTYAQVAFRLPEGASQVADSTLASQIPGILSALGLTAAATPAVDNCRVEAPGPWIEDMAAATAAEGDGLPEARISLRVRGGLR